MSRTPEEWQEWLRVKRAEADRLAMPFFAGQWSRSQRAEQDYVEEQQRLAEERELAEEYEDEDEDDWDYEEEDYSEE